MDPVNEAMAGETLPQPPSAPAPSIEQTTTESNDACDPAQKSEAARGLILDEHETAKAAADGEVLAQSPQRREEPQPPKDEPPTLDSDLLHVQSTLGIDTSASHSAPEASAKAPLSPTAPPLDPTDELQRLREAVKRARGTATQAGVQSAPEVKLPKAFGADERMLDAEDGEEDAEQGQEGAAGVEIEAKVELGLAEATPAEVQAEMKPDPEGRDMLNRALEALGEQPLPVGVKAEEVSSDEEESSDSDSSDESSSSDEDSDSSSDDSDAASSSSTAASSSKAKGRRAKGPKPHNVPQLDDGLDDDDEEGGGASGGVLASKNEILTPDLPKAPFDVVPDELELRPLGKVHSIVDSVVVVAQDVGAGMRIAAGNAPTLPRPIDSTGRLGEGEGEYSVLDTGSLLAFEDRKVLGLVFEAFGSVLSPLYALRFASASDIKALGLQIGQKVSYVPSHSTYVLTRQLRIASGKGSDASNMYDEEVAEDEREFSDDEAEMEHRRRLKEGKKGKGKGRAREDAGGDGGGGWNEEGPDAKRGKGTRGRGRGGAFGASQGGRGGRQPAPLPQRPSWDPDAPMPTAGEAAAAMAMGRSKPLPYDEDGAGAIAVPTQHAPQPLPAGPSTSTPAPTAIPTAGKASLPARPGLPPKPTIASAPGTSSAGALPASPPVARPVHALPLPPQPQQQTSAPAYSYSSPQPQQQGETYQTQPQHHPQSQSQGYAGYGYAPQAAAAGPSSAPPPGAHINPLFASQWGYGGVGAQGYAQQGYPHQPLPQAQSQGWAQPQRPAQHNGAYPPQQQQYQPSSYAPAGVYGAQPYANEVGMQGYYATPAPQAQTSASWGPPAVQPNLNHQQGASYDPSQPAAGMPGSSSHQQQP